MSDEVTRQIIHMARSFPAVKIKEQFNKMIDNRQFGSYLVPEREANTWVDTFYEQDKEVFIVIGTGRLHYHEALSRKLRKDQKLFILDWKLPLIAAALEEGLTPGQQANVVYRFLSTFQELMGAVIEIFDRFITRKIKFGTIPPYQHLFPEETEKIEKELRNFLAVNLVRSKTIELFGLEWTTNYYRNLLHMLQRGVPFNFLKNQFQNIPAVVVSAGPSLEKNIELLPEIKNRAVIIAAGSSIETLTKEYNITPHFLASFDAGIGNYPHFKDLDTGKLRLIFTGDIYPRIVEEFKGALIPVEASNKPSYEIYKQYGAPPLGEALIGPSVANFALDIAVRLGCDPVILVGQDLALRDGKSHAKGNHYRMEIEDLSDYMKVKGNVEEFVYTSKSWLTMLKNFEQQIRSYRGKIIINATEGGAFIEGTVVKPLREAIEEYMVKSHDIDDKVESLVNQPVETAVEAEEVLERVIKEIHDIMDLINQALPEIDKVLIKAKNGKLKTKDHKRIRNIKEKEDQLLASPIYQHIIKTIIYGRILYYERYYSRLASEQPDKVELWVAEYQRVLFKSAAGALAAFLEELEISPGLKDDSQVFYKEVQYEN